jgi:uncharacterized protein (TIGR03067 family)
MAHPSPRCKRFQIHLSAAVVMMVAGKPLLAAALRRRHRYNKGLYFEHASTTSLRFFSFTSQFLSLAVCFAASILNASYLGEPAMRALLVCFFVFAALAAQSEEIKKVSKLEGTWDVVEMTVKGVKRPSDKLAGIQFIYAGLKCTRVLGAQSTEAPIKFDESKKPMEMDMEMSNAGKPVTAKFIYEVNGDDAKICSASDSRDPRPTEFASTETAKNTLVVLKRAKK